MRSSRLGFVSICWVRPCCRGALPAVCRHASAGRSKPAAKPKEEPVKPPAAKPAEEKKKERFTEWDKVVEGGQASRRFVPALLQREGTEALHGDRPGQVPTRRSSCRSPLPRAPGSGISAGLPFNFGDQWLISFQRAGDRILVVRRNVPFSGRAGLGPGRRREDLLHR